jgi:quercetin dioxygenase-like cupin family protein
MDIPHLAKPGEVIDAWPAWTDDEAMAVVLRTERIEVLRLHIPAGAHVPVHEASGESTIFCLQGRVVVGALQGRHELNTGQLLYLLINEPFELFGQEESSLLITTVSHAEGPSSAMIPPRGIVEVPRASVQHQ